MLPVFPFSKDVLPAGRKAAGRELSAVGTFRCIEEVGH